MRSPGAPDPGQRRTFKEGEWAGGAHRRWKGGRGPAHAALVVRRVPRCRPGPALKAQIALQVTLDALDDLALSHVYSKLDVRSLLALGSTAHAHKAVVLPLAKRHISRSLSLIDGQIDIWALKLFKALVAILSEGSDKFVRLTLFGGGRVRASFTSSFCDSSILLTWCTPVLNDDSARSYLVQTIDVKNDAGVYTLSPAQEIHSNLSHRHAKLYFSLAGPVLRRALRYFSLYPQPCPVTKLTTL